MRTDSAVWENIFAGLEVSPETILRKINKHLSQRGPMFAAIEMCLGKELKGKKIIEVGAGTGIECLLFAMKGADCFAIDFEPRAMRYARATASFFSRKPYLNVGTGFALPVKDNCADLVLSQGFLEHFNEREMVSLLKEQVRILKPSGILLVDVPNYFSAYEAYKKINGLFGEWVYGKEVGIKRRALAAMAAACGLEVVGNYGWSFKGYPYRSVLDFSYMLPLLLIRNVVQLFGYGYDSIGILFRKKCYK